MMNDEQLLVASCRDVIENNPDYRFTTDQGIEVYKIAKKQLDLESRIKNLRKSADVVEKIVKQFNFSNEMYNRELRNCKSSIADLYAKLKNLGYEKTIKEASDER